ncbi:5,6-dimethylbenzimidazole synthase [Sphingomonas sp. PB2P12]|uniref:5,6-dimethylbenzimidazole synthase n=1 Tax=Sphingomonas sandaracina TaxID=3096157 RepID=UPI002FC5FA53
MTAVSDSDDHAQASPAFDAFEDQLAELIRWRRDVRHFRRDPIDPVLLPKLLDLANLAPSVGLSQPWRFVTVDAPDRRAAVREIFAACNAQALAAQSPTRSERYAHLKLAGLDDAPCHLAVFVDPDPRQGHGLGRRTMPETAAFSAVMALHTVWLAARCVGVGLGWVSILDADRVRAALDLPENWQLIGYVCIGYPAVDSDTPELEREGWEHRRPVEITRR